MQLIAVAGQFHCLFCDIDAVVIHPRAFLGLVNFQLGILDGLTKCSVLALLFPGRLTDGVVQ